MISMLATTAIAAVDCKPYKQEAKVKEQIVADFGYELEKVEKKVIALEKKISKKLSKMDNLQVGIEQAISILTQIQDEELQLLDSMAIVEADIQIQQTNANRLIQTIQQTQEKLRNLPAGSHARRQILRENNRAKKKLEKVDEKIVWQTQSIAPQSARLAQIGEEKLMQSDQISSLKAQKAQIAGQKPNLQSLTRKKDRAEAELMDQDLMQQENLKLMSKAKEKVLMCKTYNVKYPIALDVAKEVYVVGCESYQLRDMQGNHKKDAEAEVLASVCN